MLTAVIITQDEERNIGRCLTSLEGVADEVVVVDSGSTDGTEAICRQHGVRFVHHPWEGYSEQKNWAETQATGEWVLSIDADEALSERLRTTLLVLKSKGFADAGRPTLYRLKRLTNYCGSWIRHCGWYPDAKIRLWRHGTVRWQGDIHETLVWQEAYAVETLEGDLLHYSYYTLDEHVRRQPKYYRLGAQEAYEAGKRCGWATLIAKPCYTFVRDYFFRLGMLDGIAGYLVCHMNAHYTLMKYATLRELCKKQNRHDYGNQR